MAITLNDNIKVGAGKPSEPKYLNLSNAPYTGTSQVFAQVPLGERHIGLTVNINNVEYWFENGVTNGDIVIKSDGGATITGATNGLSIESGNVVLGGDFASANLNNLSGDAVFQINIGEETITNKHSLYFDATQFYLQSIGTTGNTRNYNLSQNFTADGFEQLIFVAQDDVQISNPTGYLTVNNGVTIAGTDNVADVITSFNLSETGITLTDNRTVKKGIEYANNYSSGFTSRSIPDVEWVLSQISGGTITGATNGLSIQSGNVVLGGTLTGYTTIEGADGFALLSGDVDNGAFNEISTTVENDFSYGALISKNNSISGNTAESSVQTISNLSGSTLVLAATSSSEDVSILLKSDYNEGSILVGVLDNNLGFKGIQYKDDYSSDFGPRSIPDVEWVLSQVSSGSTGGGTITGATNGLNVDNYNVRLGGNLSGYTQLQLDGDYTTFQLYSPMGVTGVTKFGTYFSDGFQNSTGIQQANDSITFGVNSDTISASLKFDGISGITINGGAMRYVSDFSTGFTALSIPNAGWVTGLTSGGGTITGATNGLSKQSGNVVLGGALTGNTLISSSSNSRIQILNTSGRDHGININEFDVFVGSDTASQLGANSFTGFKYDGTSIIAEVLVDSIQKIRFNNEGINLLSNLVIIDEFDALIKDERTVKSGIGYFADYSANFGPRSIPDVAWITGNTGNVTITGATNGLSIQSGNVVLGGTLTGYTTIDGAEGFAFLAGDIDNGAFNEISTTISGDYSYGNLITKNNSISGNTAETSVQTVANLSGSTLVLAATSSSENVSITLKSDYEEGSIIVGVIDNNLGFKGIQYKDDYSANFGPRSIPDINWITGNTSGGSVNVSNGLSKVGNYVVLGGALSGDTMIDTSGNALVFGDPFGSGNYAGLNFLDYGFIAENQTNPLGITIGNYSGTTSINHNDPYQILDISSTSLLRLHTSDNGVTPVQGIEISAADKGYLYLESIDGAESTSLRISSTGDTIFSDDRNVGLKYADDYSANFDSRSIPDVEWVTNFVTDGLSVNNGLTKLGTNISLGGELTGNTSIRGAGLYNLDFGGDGSDITTNRINQFNINARNTVLRSASDSFATATIELGTGGDDSSILFGTSGIGSASLLIQQQSGIASFLVTGSGTFKGIEYADNYSANFGPRSIPDVDWITGRTVTVGNGLNISGSTVILGGNLVTFTELSIGLGSAFGIVSDSITPVDIDPNQGQFYTNFYTPTSSLQSNITQSLNSLNFATTNNTGSTSSTLSLTNTGEAAFSGSKSLTLDSTNGLLTLNSLSGVTISGAHAKYDNDYSSSYTNRSLIDKEYALGLVETEISLSSSSGEINPSKINYLGLYDTSGSAITIDLPTTPVNKTVIKIKDRTGNAGTNNLTINGNGRTIDGSSSGLINTNYGCVELIYFETLNEWFITGNVN